jgi:glutamate dehydrogenase (NADP+)
MLRNKYLKSCYNALVSRNEHETEFLQATLELLESVDSIIDEYPHYEKMNIIERILEPERIVQFRVSWLNDQNEVCVNRGYRVQYSSLKGPYKGGLRFHPSVNLSIIKFLAFEQTFKNALTSLSLGGSKGGSDFDPKGKSDIEIMRFCQSFISELYRHIGPDIDIPAGDIGVGQKEIGYMYGYYKKIRNEITGAFTGKGKRYGGSLVRKEATGYGLCYFVDEVLKTFHNTGFKDKKVIVSGSGNVAIYAAEKAIELGAQVIAMSDSSGYIYKRGGIDLDIIKKIKEDNPKRIKDYLNDDDKATYGDNPSDIWKYKCDIAMPCATQNELDYKSALKLINNDVMIVAEGANMPTTYRAVELLKKHHVLYAPGKAANAGGVIVSGLEMAQNTSRYAWSFKRIDSKLDSIMREMFHEIHRTSKRYDRERDLLFGANILSFHKIAKAMMEQGVL